MLCTRSNPCITVAVCVLLLVGSTTAWCPEGWTYKQAANRCYRHLHQQFTWDQALGACGELGGTLAKIRDPLVEQAINEMVPSGSWDYHIGLRYNHAERKWLWTDGSRLSFVRWDRNLQNSGGNGGPCVLGSLPQYGGWYNVLCDRFKRSAICERPAQ